MLRMAHNLTQKLIHDPTAQLKRVIQSGDGKEIGLARRLLGLADEGPDESSSIEDQLIDKKEI